MASVNSTPHWEVVGKGKKSKIPTPVSKSEKKKFVDNMPRIEQQAPLKESSTMFDVFLEKEKKQQASAQNRTEMKDTSKSNGVMNTGKKSVQVKKKSGKSDQEKKKATDFEEAVRKMNKEELESALALTQSSFPGNIEVWLKDLASLLSLHLEECPEPDPVLKNKPKDYPMNQLNKQCQDIIMSVIKQASVETLEHLLYHSITTMLNEMTKGNSSYGYRIFIQLLVKAKPTIALSKTAQYSELLTTNQNKVPRCLSILWCLGQCGNRDSRSGLRVWMDVMLPVLKTRSLTPFCVDYMDNLFSATNDTKKMQNEISMREYFHLLDVIFGDHHLPNDIVKKLQALYPKFKSIALSGPNAPAARNIFPSYLARATASCPRAMKNEVLPCLVNCLISDKQCFSVWCQLYTRHLQQSSILMQYLLDTWDKQGSKVDKKPLQGTLRSFSITNDELAAQGRNSSDGYSECVTVCKELLQKMEESRFPWFWIFFFLISTVTALVAFDIYTSPNIKASRTVRFLEDYGVLAFTEQVWKRISLYTGKAFSWLSVNIPLYTGKVYAAVAPYVQFVFAKIVMTFSYVIEVSSPYIQWLYLKLLQLADKVYSLSPEFWSNLGNYIWLSWDFFRDYISWIWANLAKYFLLSYKWIEKEILLGDYTPQILQQFFKTAISFVQNLAISVSQWCTQIISVLRQ